MRLTSGVVPIALTVAAWKQTDQKDSDNESPDMRPPRNAARLIDACCGQRCSAVKELHDEPESQDDHGWNFNHLDEYEYGDKGEDPREWIRNKVRAQHAGDRATGPDAGNRTVAIQNRMDNSRADSAQKIEYEEGEMSQAVLDVVAKNPQVPHVADDVQPAAVQKHGREERD
jgi:hypothetical protein